MTRLFISGEEKVYIGRWGTKIMTEDGDLEINILSNNRIAFLSVLTGFLLTIIFQLLFLDTTSFKPGFVFLLDALFICLIFIVLCFLLSFLLFLLSTYFKSNNLEKDFISFDPRCFKYGNRISLIGTYGFCLLIFFLIRLYFYRYENFSIIYFYVSFFVNLIYLLLIIIIFFILQIKWKESPKGDRILIWKNDIDNTYDNYLILFSILELTIILISFTEFLISGLNLCVTIFHTSITALFTVGSLLIVRIKIHKETKRKVKENFNA